MGYPNRSQKTDRWGNPPTSNSLSQMMGGSQGWMGATPVSIPGQPNGYNLTGKNQMQFAADNPGQLNAGLPLNNPALAAIDNARQPVSLTVTGGNHAYNNPAWGAGSIFNPAWGGNASLYANGGAAPGPGRQLPPIPSAVSGTMQRNGGLSLPFFTPKKAALPSMPDLGTMLGTLFKSTPKPKQLPMPAALPRTYGGTAAAFRGAEARDRLTAPKGGQSHSESQARFETTAISRANAGR